MTQSSLQTQCPKCRTRFRVTDEQLGIAKGKVRCGHCMDVFNAVEHQVAASSGTVPDRPSGTSSKVPVKPGPSERPASGFISDTTEDDFIFADNPEEDAEDGPYAGTRLTFSDDELSDSFRGVDDRSASTREEQDDDNFSENIDESWAEAILQEDSSPQPSSAESEPEPEPEPEAEKIEVEPEFQQESERKPTPEPEANDSPDIESKSTSVPPEDDTQGFYVDEQPDPAFESFADEHGVEPKDGREQQNESFAAGAPFGDLRRDPVSVGSKNRSWLRTLTWSVIVLGLLGVLIAQVTWFQFDRLSAIPELRPFYEKGCELAGCELKPLINVEAIQSRKLVVRTNPENRNQLVVDAVIVNRADFQQPFPAIALTFSNLNGDVVAQSVFTPSEYLAGDAEGLQTMPVETPVRIAISIRDPGRDAVNYNLGFRPYVP
ncbi:DUF3426 domain-containing protein [Marinobacter sp. 2_MG-2023]|uniref:DUF3426 domain-containing protein n=1 Tax=Marinobacter sp. 2_MG-2023 TaxID=3062679 RepID=UPI0026E38258|nr:DUF3426 domain-containing protein [Marinobacter sp. 2_MG-2023]MDO6441334.1 DUF3426 domain-containing protein [Marinobacter sp. 2_MG-2023]